MIYYWLLQFLLFLNFVTFLELIQWAWLRWWHGGPHAKDSPASGLSKTNIPVYALNFLICFQFNWFENVIPPWRENRFPVAPKLQKKKKNQTLRTNSKSLSDDASKDQIFLQALFFFFFSVSHRKRLSNTTRHRRWWWFIRVGAKSKRHRQHLRASIRHSQR